MAAYGPTAMSAPAGAIIIHVGDNVSAIVSQAAAGATFFFEAGVHRGVSITPKDNQTFLGAKGAILNGSALLTNFTQAGNAWVVGGQSQEGIRRGVEWPDGGAMRAGYPETVFVNDKPLKPVDALSKVAPGTFYFDYAADKIYIGDNPAGKKVEAGKLDRAFGGSAANVTIQNLVIEKYDPPIQAGAIHTTKNWLIKNNEVRLNYGIGVVSCDNSKIVGNYVHDNGEMGLAGMGKNILVEGNEIARNGHWSGINVFWEGGGFKFVATDHLVVRGNYSHDNKGFGMWTDIDNIHTLYENNVVTGNSGGGISHEISYDATIRNNTLVGNGFAAPTNTWMWGGQIQIHNSSRVDVYGNKLDMTGAAGGNGITLIQETRGMGAYGPRVSAGNHIHDNIIVSRDGNGRVGGAAWPAELASMLAGGNTWSNNHYYMADGARFWWSSTGTFAQFKGATGESGTLSQAYPDTTGWVVAPSGGTSGSVKPDQPVKGTSGRDVLVGTSAADSIAGLGGNDDLSGLGGNDTLNGGTGRDRMKGGAGNDTYIVDRSNDTVVELKGQGTDHVKSSASFTLGANVERLTLLGSSHSSGTGNELANTITGNSGNNKLSGLAGKDTLKGGAGNDALAGGTGDDTLDGGKGRDTMVGGTGNDTYVVDSTGDVVSEIGGGGIDTVRSTITFNLGSATQVKGAVENLVLLGAGNTNGFGNSAANAITGNSGKNSLSGGAGNDVLRGGSGNDTLIGGPGKDTLVGGPGADTFYFGAVADTGTSAATRDVIKDFSHGQHDKIDLLALDAKAGPGNQSFTFIGDSAFTGAKGLLRYTLSGTTTIIEGDINGNGTANFQIELTGHKILSSDDFIL